MSHFSGYGVIRPLLWFLSTEASPHHSVSAILLLRFETTMNRKGITRPKRSKLREFLIYLVLLLVMLGLLARPLAKGAMFYQSY
jgi:hypothetical protein